MLIDRSMRVGYRSAALNYIIRPLLAAAATGKAIDIEDATDCAQRLLRQPAPQQDCKSNMHLDTHPVADARRHRHRERR